MRNKILIVEDNPELLGVLRLALRTSGFSVATATDGIEALKKTRSILPDLVVLDLILPELDGFAVCETLRKSPETASIPIIVLTGLSSQLARLAGIESGANEYLTKPLSPALLIQRIRSLLSTRKEKRDSEPVVPPTRGKSSARIPLVLREG